jgi:pyrimidine operon attenuation protein/uracil phosphoribosyltransferase
VSTDLPDIEPLLEQLTTRVGALIAAEGEARCTLVGIHQGGAWLARALQQRLGLEKPPASLDIAFYRDDLARAGLPDDIQPSRMPLNIDDQVIILVDDILYTGRTLRAAMNEIFDYGRPAAVRLAVLLERPGRELPVAPDIAAAPIELGPRQRVKLRGPDPLHLVIEEASP